MNKARECVRFVIELVGSIGGEEALKLEDGFEAILNGTTTTSELESAINGRRERRYNGRVYLNILQKVEALDLFDKGHRPRDLARRYGCSPNLFMGKRLGEMRVVVGRFKDDQAQRAS